MRKLTLMACCALMAFACKEKAEKTVAEETPTMAEAKTETSESEWTVLFDGKSFDGWKEYMKDDISDNWKIEDGAMVFYPPEKRERGQIFDLVTEKEYTDFVLSLDWKISEGGNSGVFWGINEEAGLGKPYESGPEVQVIDNEKHPDAKNGLSHQAGALYDMVDPTEDVTNPAGEWNTMVITVNHKEQKGSVELNGKKTVEFPVGNEMWNVMVSKSKFANWEHFGKYVSGKIGVQDHGNQVAFKNIKIREL
ncbi:DUF1080 domain-containing protein [Euzebyella marina]|uniref:DUF1080 domain-containing protein n=1 Tax=Euzebyella marina TaxID=1761453 RepID=A0A3G2L1Y5_9FLAO|nr:DUF1080 domain-containing protein [Euzebyella marina]AYN66253.1 DUF1080 domain-containing protein [Euzebyella marina]MBG50155.1 glycosyl hydrolase [Pseudozobellia sp.]|tara:strand:- start:498 stop:1250 length:753 start_codon:yes stop_codon:yes gene_type:complete